jgi:psiF repeat
MRLSQTLMLSAFVILVGSGAGLAQPAPATQTPKPATPPAAAAPAAPIAKPTAADTDKKAISKACSDQATAKGLHGKERKAFRSECKKNGGKPA